MAVTPPRQCDSVSGFTGDKGGGEVREGRKVKDAPEEPLCSFRIYIARAGCAAPGPRRTSQEACALSTRAIFICAQGAAPLSLTLGIGCEGGIRSHVLRWRRDLPSGVCRQRRGRTEVPFCGGWGAAPQAPR